MDLRKAVLTFLGVATLVCNPIVFGQPLGPSQAGGEGWDPLMRDAQSYAHAHGVELAEAIRRLVLQKTVGHLDAALAQQERETFAGLWIEHSPEFRVIVQFTDDRGSDRLAHLTRGSGLAGLTRARVAAVSLAQLRADQAEVHAIATELGQRTDLGIDVRNNRVEVYVTDPIAFDAAVASSGLELPATAVLVQQDHLARPAAVLYAGLPLTTCTSGFTVKNSGGTRGILTAGHCNNAQSYQGSALTFQAQSCGNGKDIQWHTTSHTLKGWINVHHNNDPALRVNSLKTGANQAIGEYVCKVGLTTGYTCGTISDKFFQPTYAICSPHTATYLRVNAGGANLADPGDSGGPVFVGGTAYGSLTCEVFERDFCYMPIDFISAIGVSLVTTDPFPSSQYCADQCDAQYSACIGNCVAGPGYTLCVNQCASQRDVCKINC